MIYGADPGDLDPDLHRELLRQYPDGVDAQGADALRFTLGIYAAQGRDIKLDIRRIEGYRAFLNKLWNASRFALMNLEDFDASSVGELTELELSVVDRWILDRLNTVTGEVTAALEEYRFNDCSQTLYHFVWHELCDWYIEFVKPALYDESAEGDAARLAAQATLQHTLESVLRLMHPLAPFVTEDVWQSFPKAEDAPVSIMVAAWPEPAEALGDAEAREATEMLIGLVSAIRAIRGETNVKPNVTIDAVYFTTEDGAQRARIEESTVYIQRLAGVDTVGFLTPSEAEALESAATAVSDGIGIRIPLAGLIDVDEELARLQKELDRVDDDIAFVSNKLANENFVNKAPSHIVEKEREKLTNYEQERATLQQSLAEIEQLR